MFWIEVTIPAALESFEAVENFLFEQGTRYTEKFHPRIEIVTGKRILNLFRLHTTFGTTQLLLELLESHLGPFETVLGIGTGSSILAIAGAKLGAPRVLGVEIDRNAVIDAREKHYLQ